MTRRSAYPVAPVIALAGAGGIVAQVLMLRSFVVSAGGNELTMGVVLANWLILEALGAYVGDRIVTRLQHTALYAAQLVIFGFLLPVTATLINPAPRLLLGIPGGEGLGLLPLLASSIIIMGPISIVHGATFPAGCRVLGSEHGADSIGRAYLTENLGTLLGGAALSVYFAARLGSMELALIVGWLHVMAAAYLLLIARPGASASPRVILPVLLVSVLAVLAIPSAAERLEHVSTSLRWPDLQTVRSLDTPYGNIRILRRFGEDTVYYNGQPLLTAPNPDTASAEDFAHLAAAAHPDPRRMLVLAGGPGGILHALLAHPVEMLTYVDLDPDLPGILATLDCDILRSEMSDARVRVRHRDARLFLAQEEEHFDLILLGFIDPDTIQTNRLFTGEFFQLARVRLAEGGILAFSVVGSPSHVSPELVSLNASIYRAAHTAFSDVRIIPGERNLFLAGGEARILDAELVAARLAERSADPGFFSPAYIAYRLDADRAHVMEDALRASVASQNRDLNPRGLYYALGYWGSLLSPELTSVLNRLEGWGPWWISLVALIPILIVSLGNQRKARGRSLVLSIWSTGVAGMGFDLLVLFVFQTLYGFVYGMLGVLMAAFMLGLFLGSLRGARIANPERAASLFGWIEVAVIALLPLLFIITRVPSTVVGSMRMPLLVMLFAYSVLAGGVVGMQFPLAATLMRRERAVAGRLYAADLLGGWVGGLGIAVVLFPLWGLLGTTLLLATLKVGTLIAFYYTRRGGSHHGTPAS